MKRALSFVLLLLAGAPTAHAQRSSYEELQSFSAVLAQVRSNYVDSVGQAELVRAAIAGALNALDPHSVYLRAATLDRLNAANAGLAGTLGARLDHDGRQVVVLTVGSASPAARAGLRAGDRILAVNDTPTAGLSASAAEALLAGDEGTRVTLRVARGPAETPTSLVLSAKRARFRWPAVSAALRTDSATGYVRLEEFAEGSARELAKAVDRLRDQGARRLILDLRGNPGGLVDEAVRMAGMFLPKDAVIARSVGRNRRPEVLLGSGGSLRELPVVVLIDEGSASASELFAAALQDHDRARIAGRRSFGKALAQVRLPLPGGDALALTIARILSPAGRSLQREFRGLNRTQYRTMAGDSGAASRPPVTSLGGRPLDPGPGVAPDLALPAPGRAPEWWAGVLDAGDDVAVADSVAATLRYGEDEWLAAQERWDTVLAAPLLDRARTRTGLNLLPGTPEREFIARNLAARVARVKWGEAAADRLLTATDTDVIAATALFR